ncbi:MAG: hypothetical protein CVU56_29415 [Deltaproteobacteria bacterium HGW-Deltaproteobacteria-14]|nr:MAG: hypothetical protein CVU56_29415 [Deltaproteobacteria bacterium HGW-Deltaproteobacteria-14]
MRAAMVATRHIFLHGFASGPQSKKGNALRAALAARGVELALPDLNAPDFAHLTHTRALAVLDREAGADGPVALVGSSLGGYLAARWAELHPERVTRLVLLCPGFDMIARWPQLLGADAIARWRAHGALHFADGAGVQTPVHWGFIEDALRHPATPEVACPTLILHGIHDVVVPIAGSRAYAAAHKNARLIELDDDHALIGQLDRVIAETLAFLEPSG